MKAILRILCRYIVLFVLVIFFYSDLLYNNLFNITIYPLKGLLSLFYEVGLQFNTMFIGNFSIEIVPACIAVSAYVLLLILNLTTEMKPKTRFYSLLFSFSALLFLNILRIFVLTILFIKNFIYFEAIHKLFWYIISTLFVVAIWFLIAYLFKIKNIPVYTDFANLRREARKK